MSFDATLRRAFDSRLVGASLLAAALVSTASAATPRWRAAELLPVPRTEVAATRVQGDLYVIGGYLANGDSSTRVDVFSPSQNRWTTRRDLPVGLNHAAAATYRRNVYVVGGYSRASRTPLSSVYVMGTEGTRHTLRMPEGRAAAGAAVIRNTLYVVGGVGPNGLARHSFAYNIVQRRWRRIPGPTPREHLAVVAANGRLYALAGRKRGLDTNVRLLETWRPGERKWTRLAPIPSPRGGTGAAVVERTIVSVGGEAPRGTIASVYAYNTSTRRWRRLADLPTPRHGLGVVALKKRVYAIGGGPQPGLTVSSANEYLTLP